MKAVQHDFDFQKLLWTSNNASAVHSVIAQKATSKNTIILFKVPVWVVLDVSLFLSNQHELHVLRLLDNLHTMHICVPTCTLNYTQETQA